MIDVSFDNTLITLKKVTSDTYDVILNSNFTLPSKTDTLFNSSIQLSFDKDYESALFYGCIADDSDDYNDIYIPSNFYTINSDDKDNVKIYFYTSRNSDIIIPEGKSIGQIKLFLKYSDNNEEAIDTYFNTKIIYDNNGLKVISTDVSTEDITETEMVVEPDGMKYLKIIYPNDLESESEEESELEEENQSENLNEE